MFSCNPFREPLLRQRENFPADETGGGLLLKRFPDACEVVGWKKFVLIDYAANFSAEFLQPLVESVGLALLRFPHDGNPKCVFPPKSFC